MGIVRGGEAEAALQPDLARGGHEQILPAHDVGDALFGVVGHHGELVGPQAVGAQEDEIADVAGEVLYITADDAVGEGDGFIGHAQPPGGHSAGGFGRRGGEPCTGAVVNEAVHALPRLGMPLFAAAIAGVGEAALLQAVQGGAVEMVAAALVGHFAVPFKAECFEGAQDMGGSTGHFARRVEIFHPHQPAPARRPGICIGSQGGE